MHQQEAQTSSVGTRVAYLSGPIDAAQVYEQYRRAERSEYFGTIYLAQLFELLEAVRADALVITTLPKRLSRQQFDRVTVVNVPMPEGRRGLAYHLAMMAWTSRSIAEIIRFRPAAALLTAGQDYFWMHPVLLLFGIRLMTSLHCTLWPKLVRPRAHRRLFAWLNGKLFFPACDHIQGVSQDVLDQVSA